MINRELIDAASGTSGLVDRVPIERRTSLEHWAETRLVRARRTALGLRDRIRGLFGFLCAVAFLGRRPIRRIGAPDGATNSIGGAGEPRLLYYSVDNGATIIGGV